MDITQTTAQLNASHANLAGSTFTDVNLAQTRFTDVNLSGSVFTDINFSGVRLANVNLANMDIRDCAIDGLRINGHLVSDLIKAHGAKA